MKFHRNKRAEVIFDKSSMIISISAKSVIRRIDFIKFRVLFSENLSIFAASFSRREVEGRNVAQTASK